MDHRGALAKAIDCKRGVIVVDLIPTRGKGISNIFNFLAVEM